MGALTHIRPFKHRPGRNLSMLILVASLLAVSLVDLTILPELPAVIAYELGLLAALLALINLFYVTKKH